MTNVTLILLVGEIMAKVPCYKCEDRIVGCHSTCERYIAYRKETDEQNKLIQKNRNLDSLRITYEIYRANRMKDISNKRKFKKI